MKSNKFDCYDVGTIDNYIKAKNLFKDSKVYSIPKTNGEFLYKVKHNFIKLSSDKDFIKNRIKRTDDLDDLVQTLNYSGDNVYAYEWVDGDTLYNSKPDVWKKFLDFANKNLWEETYVEDYFIRDCEKFYFEKKHW